MRMVDIIEESHHTAHTMTRIYKVLSQMNKDIAGGNSGMVALAVHNFYKTNIKANMRLALIYSGANASSTCELITESPVIHGVANKFGAMAYMANYQGSADGIVRKFATQQIKGARVQWPDIISDIDPSSDSCINAVIRKHTNWDTDAYEFYQYLKDNY